jgi:hypothetical protein
MSRLEELIASVPMSWRMENHGKAWFEYLSKEDQQELAELMRGLFAES